MASEVALCLSILWLLAAPLLWRLDDLMVVILLKGKLEETTILGALVKLFVWLYPAYHLWILATK